MCNSYIWMTSHAHAHTHAPSIGTQYFHIEFTRSQLAHDYEYSSASQDEKKKCHSKEQRKIGWKKSNLINGSLANGMVVTSNMYTTLHNVQQHQLLLNKTSSFIPCTLMRELSKRLNVWWHVNGGVKPFYDIVHDLCAQFANVNNMRCVNRIATVSQNFQPTCRQREIFLCANRQNLNVMQSGVYTDFVYYANDSLEPHQYEIIFIKLCARQTP